MPTREPDETETQFIGRITGLEAEASGIDGHYFVHPDGDVVEPEVIETLREAGFDVAVDFEEAALEARAV